MSKKRICVLHEQFFQDPTPTDCITFPSDEEACLGEIFICPKVAEEYDPRHPLRETTLYIIHGILHLLGYTDLEAKERTRMYKEQMKLLKASKEAGCSLEF